MAVRRGGKASRRGERLHIAIDGRYLAKPGMGINSYVADLVQVLASFNLRVTVLTNVPPADDWTGFAEESVWVDVFGSTVNLVWEQWDVARKLRQLRPDAYWAPANCGVPLLPVGGSTVKIWTLHDLIPLRLWRRYLLPHPGYALPWLLWTLSGVLRSDYVVTDSASSALDIRRRLGRHATVIAPLLSDARLQVASDMAANTGVDAILSDVRLDGRPYVIYNGGNEPRKNVSVLITAFESMRAARPELRLVILGSGYANVQDVVSVKGLQDEVVMTGYVEESVKWGLLRGAAALAYPSSCEGFGLPILEGFAAGVPVVASGFGAMGEVGGDAIQRVDGTDPDSVMNGLTAVLTRADLAAEQRLRGRRQLARYSPERARDDVRSLLTRVFGSLTNVFGSSDGQ